MSRHYPYVSIEWDLFDHTITDDPRDVAEAAWHGVEEWIDNGLRPIITVHFSPIESVDVDLAYEEEA